MKITTETQICMAIGDPVKQSLGPSIYNDIYAQVGLDGKYVYLACNIKVDELKDFINAVKVLNIRGISCTVPHKGEVMKYLDEIDEVAQKIGAVNSIVNDNGQLKGYNTDWIGIVKPLSKVVDISGKRIALIGAGGAARAVAYAVVSNGGNLSIYNRTQENAKKIIDDFGGKSGPLDSPDIAKADIIINATSVGMHPETDKSPISKSLMNPEQIVFDAIHTPALTQLQKDAQDIGAKTISGREMFIYQGIEQFRLYTGIELDEQIVRKQLEKAMADKTHAR